jgi:hypothetical protein
MTTQEADQLVREDLDGLRVAANKLTVQFGQPDNARWIGSASRKQLLAEVIRLYANNHNAKEEA